MRYIVALLLLLSSPALADDVVPVKDRCGHPTVLKVLLGEMDEFYPSLITDKGAFTFDPDTTLTLEYDKHLDLVQCRANFVLHVERVNKPWAATIRSKMKLVPPSWPKTVFYRMQYVSGSDEHFRLAMTKTIDRKVQDQKIQDRLIETPAK